ncbi:carbon-nitrogen hydrolase family protein [Fluviicoccus keumensis]|nr:carbon-nitrogen hydrolase family protein [Fluviicoccus keumensis]
MSSKSPDSVMVAAIQMNSQDSLTDNLAQLDKLLAEAALRGVKLAVLPENFAVFGAPGQAHTASQLPAILTWLADACRRYRLWIVAGSLPSSHRPDGEVIPDGRVRSACFILDEEGVVQGRYDKIHLFDAEVGDRQATYRESAVFEPGSSVVTVPTPWGRVGLTICYDLRFPELFMALRKAGTDLLVLPAAFTAITGEAHWETLLRARAIETQCFVIAAGQTGKHGALRETWGHSMVINPWGKVLDERPEPTPGVVAVACDLGEMRKLRHSMPLMSHRRLSY